ncbi:PilN domain-containing protein [Prosthecomicrobium hirschii]|uniref:PilN domain-containing protein n=1 Tax=Prosthecodimorpha hirschii TaxID=665126 RepID=UPI00221F968A|nr:PilN domain-containing protein [Prosthecomicrobium hirschii]MCW1842731.1 PilN domain-containing protein [Prosthecomicrobium hirschii]
MLKSIDRFARWWVDGLADLMVAAGRGRSAGRAIAVRAEAGASGVWTVEDGTRRGRITVGADGLTFEPADLPTRLEGAAVAVDIPEAWLFRRALEPVAAQSAPYLDAFVRHHVERVTPWRVGDTYYGVETEPLAEDPSRLSVRLGVVPRSLVAGLVEGLRRLKPRRLDLSAAGDAGRFVLTVAADADGGRVVPRRIAGTALAVLVIAAVAGVVAASWTQELTEGTAADLDRAIAERRDFLRTAMERTRPKSDPAEGLRAQRSATPPMVLLVDQLAAALPDQAHLTDLRIEKGLIRMSGVAEDVSALIPALEASPSFRSVAFYAPSTRLPSGSGDRFYIEMRIEPVRSAEAIR